MRDDDTFEKFVSLLSAGLNRAADRTDSLAATLFVSRSHLDRIVSAVSGEPPGRFKRRILLERSAFRLLVSADPVLEVGVGAGYGSHEAFSRAFRAAYGLSPTAWRRHPTPIVLASPNNVHFHPPAGLRLPSAEKVTSMDLLVRMTEHHVWLTSQLVERAAQLSDAQLDTTISLSVPGVDENPTLRSLLSRLIGQMDMWNEVIAMRSYDWSVEQEESVTQLRERLARVAPVFLAQVRDVVETDRLEDTFVFAEDPPKVFTYGGLIAHVLTFAAHRRTLAVGALEGFGIGDLDNGDPREWVTDPPADLLPA